MSIIRRAVQFNQRALYNMNYTGKVFIFLCEDNVSSMSDLTRF